VGESSIGLVARSGRAGERLRWVVRLPGWLRVGLLADAEAVRRITAFTLYCLFVPLAFLLELVSGGAADHPALVATATLCLAVQAAATWLIRPMSDSGWLLLILAIPASFAAYAHASASAGEALSIVLVVPVAWVAVFLSVRMVTVAVTMNSLALGWLAFTHDVAGRWLTFAVRGLTLAVIAFALHLLVVALRRAQHQAERRADLDAATGLMSRARMLDILDTVPMEGSRSAGVIVLDIDHFKQVNDRYGHLAGDQALRDVAHVLQVVVREDDILARWGGEEFLLLLPGIAEHELGAAAEKLRKAVEDHPFLLEGARVSLTISAGAAAARPGAAMRTVVAAADDALYQAKRGGRNQTIVARPRVNHIMVSGRSQLDTARRAVEEAAARAELPPDQALDAVIAVSEACMRLLPEDDRNAELAVTIHDRPETFTIVVEDRAGRRPAPRKDALNVAILDRVGDEIRFDERDAVSEVRIVFAKLGEDAASGHPVHAA
jgi:diguanylate cyclase (GGDEF)-like protein